MILEFNGYVKYLKNKNTYNLINIVNHFKFIILNQYNTT